MKTIVDADNVRSGILLRILKKDFTDDNLLERIEIKRDSIRFIYYFKLESFSDKCGVVIYDTKDKYRYGNGYWNLHYMVTPIEQEKLVLELTNKISQMKKEHEMNITKSKELETMLEENGCIIMMIGDELLVIKDEKKKYFNIEGILWKPVTSLVSMIMEEVDKNSDPRSYSWEEAKKLLNTNGVIMARTGWFPNKLLVASKNGKLVKMTEYWETEYIPTANDTIMSDWVFVNRKMILNKG